MRRTRGIYNPEKPTTLYKPLNLVRDQEVGGSNPLAQTIRLVCHAMVCLRSAQRKGW